MKNGPTVPIEIPQPYHIARKHESFFFFQHIVSDSSLVVFIFLPVRNKFGLASWHKMAKMTFNGIKWYRLALIDTNAYDGNKTQHSYRPSRHHFSHFYFTFILHFSHFIFTFNLILARLVAHSMDFFSLSLTSTRLQLSIAVSPALLRPVVRE